MKRRLKINGIIMAVAILGILAFPRVFIRYHSYSAKERLFEIFGIAAIILGQLLRVSARGYKSEHSLSGQLLIQGGPYTLVRNPMYLGIILIGTGVVFTLFQWWVLCIFLAIFILRYLFLIFQEEKKLLAKFHQTYQDYCHKVPRLIPLPKAIAKTDISAYLPLKLAWFKKEIGSILGVLVVTLLLKSWIDISSNAITAYLQEALTIIITFILFIALVTYLNKKTRTIYKNVSD
jgi:protein-S-isoprenylcysteine O-methyltransferase Ste14